MAFDLTIKANTEQQQQGQCSFIFLPYVFVHVFGDVFVQSLGVAYSMSGARMRAAVEWRQTSEPGRATIHQPVENRTTLHTHLRTSFFFLKLYLYSYFFAYLRSLIHPSLSRY